MRPTKLQRAFTLVEMLLVIAIISILAAMAISNFSNASQDTRTSSHVSNWQSCRKP